MTVYFLQAANGGPIKIGCSNQPNVREAALAALFPYGVELLCQLPGERTVETFLHQCFEPLRMGNEWFRSHPAIWRLVIEVLDNQRLPWLPEMDRWDQDRVRQEAVGLFGSLEGAKVALGYSKATPINQIFSITSGSSYSVQSRLAFRGALSAQTLPRYIAALHERMPLIATSEAA